MDDIAIKTQVICAIITASGTVLAAVIAFFSARYTARREIKKLKLQWTREDNLTGKKEFAEMTAAVSRYLQSGWSRHQREALESVAILQVTAHGDLLTELSTLSDLIASDSLDDIPQQLRTVIRLNSAINRKKK